MIGFLKYMVFLTFGKTQPIYLQILLLPIPALFSPSEIPKAF